MKEPAWRHPLVVLAALVGFVALAFIPAATGDVRVAKGAVLIPALVFIAAAYLIGLITVPAFERRWPKGTWLWLGMGCTSIAAPVVVQRLRFGAAYWPAGATESTVDVTTTAMFGVLWTAGVVIALLTAYRRALVKLLPERYTRPLLIGSLAAALACFTEWMLDWGPSFLEFSGIVPLFLATMVFFRQLLATIEQPHAGWKRVVTTRSGAALAAVACWLTFSAFLPRADLWGRTAPLFGASFIALTAYVVAATVGDLVMAATARSSSVRVRLFVMGVVAVAAGAVLHRFDFAFRLDGAPAEVQAGVTLIGNFIAVTSLVTIFGATLARSLSRSLFTSANALKRIRAGDLSVAVDASGNDELAEVARSINQMAEQLKDRAFLERINAELRSRQAQLADALKKRGEAEAELIRSEKMASVAGLVKGIAHELNNPVSSIAGNIGPLDRYCHFLSHVASELADGRARTPDELAALTKLTEKKDLEFVTRDLAALTADIAEGARRAKLIIGDLQSLSSTGQRGVEQVDLVRVVKQTVSLLSPRLPPGVKIETEVQQVAPIAARAGQIEQVMINLVDNAVRAVRDRGTIKISLAAREGNAVLTVADNGCGISPEVQLEIFKPFFTTRAAGEGSGLGLAIVAQIVRDHHGVIALESELGRGSSFGVMLPLETGLEAKAAR